MKILPVLVIVLFSALGVRSAHAFTLLYSPSGLHPTTTGWANASVTFDIDTSCNSYQSDVNAALNGAQDLWNRLPSSNLVLSIGATVTLPSPITTYVGSTASAYAPVGNPIVYCDTAFQANSGADANSIPGYAAAQNFVAGSGQLQGGLLVLNLQSGGQANIQTLGANSASIILAHEVGHVLGLGHSSDPNALMYYATNSSRKLILAQDDVDAISFLYPRSEPKQGGLLGCATISTAGGASIGGGRGPVGSASTSRDGAAECAVLLALCAVAWRRLRSGVAGSGVTAGV